MTVWAPPAITRQCIPCCYLLSLIINSRTREISWWSSQWTTWIRAISIVRLSKTAYRIRLCITKKKEILSLWRGEQLMAIMLPLPVDLWRDPGTSMKELSKNW
jgi:hypothetical protein